MGEDEEKRSLKYEVCFGGRVSIENGPIIDVNDSVYGRLH